MRYFLSRSSQIKEFRLCKPCLIVFGAVLAFHDVNASEKVDHWVDFD